MFFNQFVLQLFFALEQEWIKQFPQTVILDKSKQLYLFIYEESGSKEQENMVSRPLKLSIICLGHILGWILENA